MYTNNLFIYLFAINVAGCSNLYNEFFKPTKKYGHFCFSLNNFLRDHRRTLKKFTNETKFTSYFTLTIKYKKNAFLFIILGTYYEVNTREANIKRRKAEKTVPTSYI